MQRRGLVSSTDNDRKYVTNAELESKLDRLEARVLSKWEGRALILGAVVATKYAIPTEVTATAIFAVIAKSAWGFFAR